MTSSTQGTAMMYRVMYATKKPPRRALWTSQILNLLLKGNNSFNKQDHLQTCDFKCWRCAFKWNRHSVIVWQFFLVVPKVSYPVDARLCAMRDVPFNSHVALTKQSFGPVKPSRQTKNCSQQEIHFSFVLIFQELTKWNEINALRVSMI